MKILHTSDWHLGMKFKNISLIEAQKEFLLYLTKVVKDNNIDVVLVAGDIFDNSVSSAEAIELYSQTITQLVGLNAKIIIIAGNHDGAERLSSLNTILETNGIYIRGNIKDSLQPINIANINFYAFPYFNKDEINAFFNANADTLSEAYEALLKNIDIDKNKKNILISHIFSKNAVLSESEISSYVGGSSQVDASIFNKFDYVALGHLHHRQKVMKNVYYSGAPMKYSFGDSGIQGFIKVEVTDKTDISFIDTVTSFDMLTFSGAKDELLSQAEKKPTIAFVKLELNDTYANLDTQTAFKKFYPNLMAIKWKDNALEDTVLTMEQVGSLNPLQLASGYINANIKRDMTAEEEAFFIDALDSVNMEVAE